MLEEALTNFMDIIGSAFGAVFDWIFDFIFSFLGLFTSFGKRAFTSISSFISDSLFSGDIIYYFLGAIIFFFLFGIVIRIIRG